jgi:hypothetical protein
MLRPLIDRTATLAVRRIAISRNFESSLPFVNKAFPRREKLWKTASDAFAIMRATLSLRGVLPRISRVFSGAILSST